MKNDCKLPPKTLEKRTPPDYGRVLFSLFLGVTMMFMLMVPASAATVDIWDKAEEIMKDVYSQIVAISTIAGVVCAATALLLMNFSKNDRTVSESRAWLKRILISWAIINGLGFILAYLTPLFSGGTTIT